MKIPFYSNVFVRQVSLIAGGTATAQIIAVAASPVITRLYGPDDFGLLAIYAALLAITSVAASLRYEMAVPLPEDKESAIHIVFLSCGVVCALAMGLVVVGFVGGREILDLFRGERLFKYYWLLPLGFIGAGLYGVFNYWCIRQQQYRVLARTRITQGIGMAAAQIGLGVLSFGPFGLLLGHFIGKAAGTFSLASLFRNDLREERFSLSVDKVRDVAFRYRRFPQFSTVAGLMSALGSNLPALLIAGYYGTAVAGSFLLAQKVVGTPLSLIGKSISQVYQGHAAEKVRNNPRALRQFFMRIAIRLFLIGLVPFLLFFFAGEQIFSFVFGREWVEAGSIAGMLAIMFLVRFVVNPLSMTLNLIERQELVIVGQLIFIAGAVGSLFLAKRMNFTSIHAVGLYSIVMSICYLLILQINLYALRNYRPS